MGDEALRQVHERYRARLAELLEAPEPPRADEMTRAVFAVFDPAALADPALRAASEVWLADLIARTAPRSDAVLARAAATFGWTAASGEADPRLAAVSARLAPGRPGDGRPRDSRPGAAQSGPAPTAQRPAPDSRPMTITPPRVTAPPKQGLNYWVAGGMALVVVGSAVLVLVAASTPPRPPSIFIAPPASASPPPSAAPQVTIVSGRVEISMGSTETADTYMTCDASGGEILEDCRIERSTSSDRGEAELGYVKGLVLSADQSRQLGPQRTVAVHVHWQDMS
jgi:hypothetical protein